MQEYSRSLETHILPHLLHSFGDNFGMKYERKEDIDHLIKCIKQKYELTEDWACNLYCGIQLKWDYVARTLNISMPGYIIIQLQKYRHASPSKRSIAPTPPNQSNTEATHNARSPPTRHLHSQRTTSNTSNA
jgi:hypothetical protein